MPVPLPPNVAALLDWAQATQRGDAAKRARVPLLLQPWLSWLERVPVVKVAGTNGKGSVCALLSAVLRRDGRRPALFTSPHLVRVNERFRVDEREVETERLEHHAARVWAYVRELVRREGEAVRPTFFEALLAVALDLFRDEGCDVLVCEAGVGGAHDATSLLPGALGAITSIGWDHQDVLGDSLEAIAADKAGIVGPGAHLVLGPALSPELCALVVAHAPGVHVEQARRDSLRVTSQPGEVPAGEVAWGGETLRLGLPLRGAHQLDNVATLIALAGKLKEQGVLREPRSLAGLEDARWPCRLELREGRPRLLLDAAHNRDGLEALARALDEVAPFDARVVAFGLSQGKDAAACVALLPRLAPRVLLVEGFHRARATSELRALLPPGIALDSAFATPAALLEHVPSAPGLRDATLIVCGSIFLLGEVRQALECDAGAT